MKYRQRKKFKFVQVQNLFKGQKYFAGDEIMANEHIFVRSMLKCKMNDDKDKFHTLYFTVQKSFQAEKHSMLA